MGHQLTMIKRMSYATLLMCTCTFVQGPLLTQCFMVVMPTGEYVLHVVLLWILHETRLGLHQF